MDAPEKTDMIIHHLPGEIWIIILHKLSQQDLISLSQASKSIFRTVQSEIYRNFTVTSDHEKHHDVTESQFIKPYLIDGSPALQLHGVYEFIRSLEFTVPSHTHSSFHSLQGLELNETTMAARRALEHLEFAHLHKAVADILRRLPSNSLQNFSWQIGCCLPFKLFSGSGYLARHQKHITSLSVRLDAGYAFVDSLDGLLILKDLRHFSWQEADFIDSYIFHEVIKANCHQLKTLDIGFQYRTRAAPLALELALRSAGLFSPRVDDSTPQFKALHGISLRNVSFKLACRKLFPTFDISDIRSLKLNNCGCVLNFLKAIRASEKPINLKSLEFDYEELSPSFADYDDMKGAGSMVMEAIRFVESFQGLRHLYVRAMDFTVQSTERTPWAILNHAHTLKRLVYHYHDKLGMGAKQDCPLFWAHHLYHVLNETRLEALGLNIVPCELRTKLVQRPRIDGSQSTQTLKLLHLRITGQYHSFRNLLHKLKVAGLPKECVPPSLLKPKRRRTVHERLLPIQHVFRMSLDETKRRMKRLLNMMEFLNFIKWAFGPDGLPNLLIIAYGDFSLKERFGWTQIVFCRYPRPGVCIPSAQEDKSGVFGPALPFRIMHPEDQYLWDEIEGGREMLKACPQDTGLNDSVARYRGDNDEIVFDESYYSDSDMEGAELAEEDEWDMFEEDFFD